MGPDRRCSKAKCKAAKQPLSLAHALSCNSLRARFRRHNAILDDIMCWLRARRITVSKEVSGLTAGGNDRVDLLVRCEGTVFWGDVSLAEPGSPSYVANSSKKEGWAAEKMEAVKFSKWKQLVPKGSFVKVQPLVLETTGRLGVELQDFLKTMEEASRGATIMERHTRDILVEQMSVTCVKYNVECVNEAMNGDSEA